jgi:transcriptional regulator with XRE-family HTH domain
MKQSELAKNLDISQGTLSNWERNIHDPDTESLITLSEIFDVTTDYLLGKSDVPTHPPPYPTPTIDELLAQQGITDEYYKNAIKTIMELAAEKESRKELSSEIDALDLLKLS